MKKQVPGETWTFNHKPTGLVEVGILPSVYGESNDFALWRPNVGRDNGGSWVSQKTHKKRVVELKRLKGIREKTFQQPGETWVFINRITGEQVSGTLPARGESNDFAYWQNSGCWRSAKFSRDRNKRRTHGETPKGLLGLMDYRLIVSRRHAEIERYAPPDTTAEKMVSEWLLQDGKCAACGGPLGSLVATRNEAAVHYEHCHETGKTRGFVHKHCNFAEAAFLKMSNEEMGIFIDWIKKVQNRE